MAVAVDHRADRALAEPLVDQRQSCRGGFPGGQRVDHDPPGRAAHHGHVRNVEPADLPDAVGDLVEPVVAQVGHLAPQRRVDRCRSRALDPVVGRQIPHRLPLGIADHRLGQGGNESAGGKFAVAPVLHGQSGPRRLLRGDGRRAGGLGLQGGIGRSRGGGLGQGGGAAQQQGCGAQPQGSAMHGCSPLSAEQDAAHRVEAQGTSLLA